MAEVAFDPNQQENSNTSTTNILANQNSQASQQDSENQDKAYISTGNPYGKYATPNSGNAPLNQANQNTVKKNTGNTPSSGQHTNVQSYINKNQSGSQKLGQAVSGKLQTSADLARQNLQSTQKSFNQGMDAGSLENYQGAVEEAKGAYQQAATQKAPERQFYENQATMYTPGNNEQDKALIASNQARAVFGDGTTKDFKTQQEAQQSIDAWNKQNPGYYTYGDQPQLSVSDDRLSDILNAKYAGPTDLHQAAGYSDVYNQFNKTQSLQDLAQSSGFKGTLLKETFANPNTNYSLGNQLLDDLLLGQGQAAQTLKQTADNLGQSPTGKMTDELGRNILDARNQAKTRASEIDQVRMGSRTALDEVALGREQDIEGRLSGVLKDWDKYPQHYRDVLTAELNKHNMAKDQFGNFTNVNNQFKNVQSQLNPLAEKFSSGSPRQVYDDFMKLSDEKTQLEYNLPKYEQYFGPYGQILSQSNPQEYQKALATKQRLEEINADLSGITSSLTQQSGDIFGGGGLNGGSTQDLIKQLQLFQSHQNQEYDKYKQLSDQQSAYQKQIEDMNKQYGVDFNKFDPNSMNLGLSQLESEMLGIKGGEGLYNLLSQPGGIDNLIKTAKADKNKLVSQDEQSQLARLQSIAQLADDYGSEDSGISFRNEYNNRDLAGNQSALDALDMNNLRDKLQGSEKEFRDFADAKTVTGVGTGKGSSGGAFGKKTTKVTRYLDANLGDMLEKSNGYRNMYSDEGVNNENVDKILGLSQMIAEDDGGYVDRSVSTGVPQASRMGSSLLGDNSTLGKATMLGGAATGDYGATIQGIGDLTGDAANIYKNIVGDIPILSQHAGLLGGVSDVVSNIGSGVSSGMFGNAAKASAKAERKAYDAAAADLQNQVKNTLNTSGYGNQFVKQNNTQRDMELLQLLGLLDTTNR